MTVTIAQLTSGEITGTGTFDTLMKGVKAHLIQEYSDGRINGADYAEVYLGSMQSVLSRATEFLLSKDKLNLELEILELQRQTALIEKDRAGYERDLAQVQVTNASLEGALLTARKEHTDAQKLLTDAQVVKVAEETALITQQVLNAVTENTVLVATECKLKGEFDVLVEQKSKVAAETALLNQRKVTEQAQTTGSVIDATSVLGKQIALYTAQRDGFIRNAEQKAASILTDSWVARRTTDTGTVADSTNKLDDVFVGRAIDALLTGAGA